LFDEPINSVSNVALLIAALAAWWKGRQVQALSAGLWVLLGLSVRVGLGSALWHTFATPRALVLDVVPLMLFQLASLWLYGRHVAGLPTTAVAVLLLLYLGAGLWPPQYQGWLNGVLLYAPTLAVAWVVGLHYCLSARPERLVLLAGAVVFCAALTCRTIDLLVCRQVPLGTHFLWHVLLAFTVYLALRAWVVAGAGPPAAQPGAAVAARGPAGPRTLRSG
jgi:hypothetical protein